MTEITAQTPKSFWWHCKESVSLFLWKLEYDLVELLNGLNFFGLGLLMLFSQRDSFAITKALSNVPFIFSIKVLAIANILIGILKIYALKKMSIRSRKWFMFIAVFIWAFYTVLFEEGQYRNIVILLTAELSLFSLWAYIRLVIKHRGQRLLDPRDKFKI